MMATCKDCLHVDVCYMVEHYGVDPTEDNQEYDCHQFQDRSRFVELPCKFGDRVWINGVLGIGRCEEHEITKVHYTKGSKTDMWFYADLVGYKGQANCCFGLKEIGKTVFLSLEEAEKALAERRSNG